MAVAVSTESVTRAIAHAVSGAWASTPMGALASTAAGAPVDGAGWTVTIPVSGAASGLVRLWFERDNAIACAARVLGAESPADDAVVPVLADLAQRAMAAVEMTPDAAGLTFGDPAIKAASAPPAASSWTATFAEGTSRFAVETDFSGAPNRGAAAPAEDSRLEAVLDVDLPLVVRFGRAVMPLRAVADLSPGSVVDMGRSPDEPVELLVGERLIARGEVVIVGGNYGVRITELTNGRRSTDVEARS